MIRRLLEIRHILYALIALVLVICAVEVALQVHVARKGTPFADSVVERLTVPSWKMHHELRPGVKTVMASENGQSVTIRTNSFGLRGPEPVMPKPLGTYRVLCLGDDTVFGGEVSEVDTLTNRLQEFLQKATQQPVEVLNGGVPGYCPLLSLLQYRTSLALLDADLIVLNFDMSDVCDDHKYRRLTQVGSDGVPVGCRSPLLVDGAAMNDLEICSRFQLTCLLKEYIGGVMNDRTAESTDVESPTATWCWLKDDAPDWNVYLRHAMGPIVHLSNYVRSQSIPIVLTCVPAPWQVSRNAGGAELRKRSGVAADALYSSRHPFELLSSVGQKYDVPFFDSSSSFLGQNKPERLFLTKSRGLSRYGHALFANGLAAFIQQNIRPFEHGSGQSIFRQATDRRAVR
ncbi:SGNH/GDSL hydrolase family protein [bacterium]|nr:SGNH/GDSL hydrolase family protein [bacterium]